MTSIETLATFFGWCSVINIGILLALLLRGFIVRKLAVRVFGVTTDEVKAAYMNVLMQYRNAMTPNNSLQRTHQSVALFAPQRPRLFAVQLNSGR